MARTAEQREAHKLYMRDWCRKHPEYVQRMSVYSKEWHAAHPGKRLERLYRWRKVNPEKEAAHRAVAEAIRLGQLVRAKTCTECGSDKQIEGHHVDYSKPLEVIWLCHRCHRKVEGRLL